MNGSWTIQLEDGSHTIYAEIAGWFIFDIKLTWDGDLLDVPSPFLLLGRLTSFQRGGHTFTLSLKGVERLGKLELTMDGTKLPRAGTMAPLRAAPAVPAVWFIGESSVRESEEIAGVEEYPLDNRFGDQPFTTVHQVSRESTTEVSVDANGQIGGKFGIEVLSVIKAELEAQVSKQTGHKIGEKVTETQTLTFSVGPNSSVVYQVIWKRKLRSGERVYHSGSNRITVPYRIVYGLSCDVRTKG